MTLEELHAGLVACRRCPRLVAWRERVARERRAAFADEEYWGRPVPGFGDGHAQILVLGLAPAAHGANRTGRMFTGDRSGDWLYRAMHRAGLTNQETSVHRNDGLALAGAYVTAPVKCAPPANKPAPAERDACASWLEAEWAQLADVAVIVCLGGYAYHSAWRLLAGTGVALPKPRPRFGHGVEVSLPDVTILCSYHSSQQNTFTGRLTEDMLDAVFARAVTVASNAGPI